ncbi:hypothetical protein DW019_09570 [Clostridium sp. AF37-5]|nr:hypothetical protein DW019_09570 [Clostridium sp. AF37-5]HBD41664.1 hypothetical protein [Lachnospiraceae bacterium]
MHGVWDAMDLAGNAEDCALPPENYKPCNLASALLRLGHGLSPYKKAKKQIFLRERAPDKICFYLFCMACSFREKSACIMEKGMVD